MAIGNAIVTWVKQLGEDLISGQEISGVAEGIPYRGVAYKEEDLPDVVYLPFFSLHLGSIFAGEIALFDVNFFENKTIRTEKNADGEILHYYDKNKNNKYDEGIDRITSTTSTATDLRNIVSSWYYRLRTIAIIASMLILIYIGIRIILSSLNPSGKAKYKNMLMDWLVSICLIFCMHYIMLFSIKVVEYITEFVTSTSNEGGLYMVAMEPTEIMTNNLDELGLGSYIDDGEFSFPTNMFGYIRLMSQFSVGFSYVGYAVIYIICVLFIIFFTFTYLKRVIYMAFLTMIAPLVALSYPIDKINDGSAQAFNMWFKEYLFNLLIQPMHMLLYYVLVSTSFNLVSQNFIYAIVAICFMVPAEKIVRQFFGFNKAQTPGLLAGAGGAALAMTGIKNLSRFAKGGKGPGGRGESGGGKDGESDDKTPKFKQTNTYDNLVGDDNTRKEFGVEDPLEKKEEEQQGDSQTGKPQAGQRGENQNREQDANQSEEQQTGETSNQQQDVDQSMDFKIDNAIANEQAYMNSEDYEKLGVTPQEWEENRRRELENQFRLEQRPRRAQQNTQGQSQSREQQGGQTGTQIRQQNSMQTEEENNLRQQGESQVEQQEQALQSRLRANREENQLGNTIYSSASSAGENESERKRKRGTTGKKKAIAKVLTRHAASGAGKLVRTVGTTGAKVAGAATLGIAGGIIGAATGDVKNALTYATTGGAVGSAIGSRAANDIGNIGNRVRGVKAGISNMKREIANEINDDEERNRVAKQKFMKDKELRKLYQQELNIDGRGKDKKQQVNEAMEKAYQYKISGVKDDKIIAQAMKEDGLGVDAADNKRIIAAKIAEKVNGSQKTLDDQMKGLKDRHGYSKAQIDKLRQAVANIDGNVS